MADLNQVTINEPTQAENVSLEEQAQKLEEAGILKSETIPSTTEDHIEETNEDTRPDWLPEKFESAEELAKAYSALEKKQSSSKQSKKDDVVEEPTVSQQYEALNNSIFAATEEFSETGELSDKTFNALEKAGIPGDFVRAYMAGQEAINATQTLEVQEAIGGKSNYDAMADWAGENLADSDLEAYNSIVESGSLEQAKVAVKGLYAQFIANGGKPPKLEQGMTSGNDVKPFGSAAMVTEAMRDPRYTKDPAFRDQVAKRLAVSDVL